MKLFAVIFQQSVIKLWHERRNVLAGIGLFGVLVLIVMLLSGCATPQTPNSVAPIAPNVAAEAARQTKESYQAQEDLYNAQATSTSAAQTQIALAPVVAMTQTAGEFAMQQTYAQATTTSAALTQTAYANQQALIAQSTSTAGVATQVAAFTQQAFLVQQDIDAKAAQRREISNTFYAIAPPLFVVALLFAIAYVGVTISRERRNRPIARDEQGKTQPIIDIVSGRYIDLSANPNYYDQDLSILKQAFIQWLQSKYGFVPNAPQITAERQDRTKEREQIIELQRIRRLRLPKPLLDEQLRFLPDPDQNPQLQANNIYSELPAPSWVELNKWDGELLPIGNDADSKLIRLDTSVRPHLMYVGRSRSGKTLTGERTEAACLLTQGWNVIVMGKRVDWMPFTEHPNFKLLAVDVRKDAQKYIDLLQILTAQMDIRDSLLASKNITTWDRYGAPSTMIIIDDYSGALIRMPRNLSANVTNEVRSLAMDAAKFGLSITIGLQDATAQNIDTTTRSQMARIVYSMDTAGKSRIALGEEGAERLPARGHFLTRFSDDSEVRRGVGFFLEDRQVEAFLASRPVKQNGEMEWIDAIIEPEALPEIQQPAITDQAMDHQQPPTTLTQWLNTLSDKEQKIVELCQAGHFSQADIENNVYGYSNGRTARQVKATIERYRELREGMGTTTTTSNIMPNSTPLVA